MSERFLIIDDSQTIQKVVQIAFTPYDIEISSVNSYIEAINELNSDSMPSLVFADASLPGIKGASDYKSLQEKMGGEVPFIVLLGSYDGIDQSDFEEQGFTIFMKKPFEAGDLITCANQALGRELGESVDEGRDLPPSPPAISLGDFSLDSEESKNQPPPPPAPPATAPETRSISLDLEDEAPATSEVPPVPSAPVFDLSEPSMEPPVPPPVPLAPPVSSAEAESIGVTSAESSGLGAKNPADDDSQVDSVPFRKKIDLATEDRGFVPPPPPPGEFTASIQRGEDSNSVSPISFETPANPETPTQGSDAVGLIEPFLREEMAKVVKEAVEDFCERHFARIAREVVTKELENLSAEKSRLLIDN